MNPSAIRLLEIHTQYRCLKKSHGVGYQKNPSSIFELDLCAVKQRMDVIR